MLSTRHLVLGLLMEHSGYAYELQKRIDGRFGFLDLSDRVVYGVLDGLERDGLIEEIGEKQVGRTRRGAPRKVYGINSGGRDEFARWILEPCDIAVVREEVHAKLVLSPADNLPQVIDLTERLEQRCLTRLREIQDAIAPDMGRLGDPDFSWLEASAILVEDAEAIRLQGIVDWLHRVRAVCRRRMEPPARRPRGGGTRP